MLFVSHNCCKIEIYELYVPTSVFFFNLVKKQVNFFDFYGRKLNTTDVGVSCKGAGSFFKKSSKG